MSVANGIPSMMSVVSDETNKSHCLLLQHVGVHLDIGGDHGHHGKTTSHSKREGLPNRHQRAKDIDVRRAAIKKLKDPNYETMVNANEEGNRTKVMVRIDKDIIRELVILTTDGGDDALIRIKGKIKPSDIEKVINDHKDGC